MYNVYVSGADAPDITSALGERYIITDDLSQANIILSYDGKISDEMFASRLVFTVVDLSDSGLDDEAVSCCSEHGAVIFRSEDGIDPASVSVRDFIENGNILSSVNFPDVTLGPFGDDISRIIVLTEGIDAPILLGAMMESSMDLRAIAGGLKGGFGAALIAGREPVTRVPHIDGVIKVRVLQDI
ncbi:MAG: hypothetical protein IKF54_00450 [Eubacterium sp.]|nr:hypothetical protein [Eubacterium sp.]